MDLDRRSFLAGFAATAGAAAASADSPSPLVEMLSHEWQRPQFHLLPAANWMNDPCAPLHFRGEYHMFYQYNPNGAFWGDMHWGHATSPDLIHWRHQPVALAPTPGGPDKDGVFSGCAVVNQGVPTILYTGVNPETQCLATSKDPHLVKWDKYSGNPIIPGPPNGMTVTGFRDPMVWREKDHWSLVLGSGRKGVGGEILLYRSADLIHWTYLHPLFEGPLDPQVHSKDTVATGEMWECPDFFPIGNKHVLLISTKGQEYYWIGTYDGDRFTAEHSGLLDAGPYYAARSMVDAKGRRILWGWIRETRPLNEYKESGWAGCMALPRVLSINRQGELTAMPVPELASLRDDPVIQTGLHVPSGGRVPLKDYGIETAEFYVEFAPPAGEVGLVFSPTLRPIEVAYDPVKQEVRIGNQRAACPLSRGEALRLHLYRDGSVLELFVNDRVCLTAREYAPGLDTVALYARNTRAEVRRAQFWPVHPISGDRLAT